MVAKWLLCALKLDHYNSWLKHCFLFLLTLLPFLTAGDSWSYLCLSHLLKVGMVFKVIFLKVPNPLQPLCTYRHPLLIRAASLVRILTNLNDAWLLLILIIINFHAVNKNYGTNGGENCCSALCFAWDFLVTMLHVVFYLHGTCIWHPLTSLWCRIILVTTSKFGAQGPLYQGIAPIN